MLRQEGEREAESRKWKIHRLHRRGWKTAEHPILRFSPAAPCEICFKILLQFRGRACSRDRAVARSLALYTLLPLPPFPFPLFLTLSLSLFPSDSGAM